MNEINVEAIEQQIAAYQKENAPLIYERQSKLHEENKKIEVLIEAEKLRLKTLHESFQVNYLLAFLMIHHVYAMLHGIRNDTDYWVLPILPYPTYLACLIVLYLLPCYCLQESDLHEKQVRKEYKKETEEIMLGVGGARMYFYSYVYESKQLDRKSVV